MDKDPVFFTALKFTLKWEGGYSNNPEDPGGATMKGIIQIHYDEYRNGKRLPQQDVKLISDEELNDIYYNYYTSSSCDKLTNKKLQIVHFDTAVNTFMEAGPMRANKILQGSTVGLVIDGIIGPKTLSTVNNCGNEIVENYLNNRESFYRIITDQSLTRIKNWKDGGSVGTKPYDFSVFLKGWLNRVSDLREYVRTIV